MKTKNIKSCISHYLFMAYIILITYTLIDKNVNPISLQENANFLSYSLEASCQLNGEWTWRSCIFQNILFKHQQQLRNLTLSYLKPSSSTTVAGNLRFLWFILFLIISKTVILKLYFDLRSPNNCRLIRSLNLSATFLRPSSLYIP